MRVWLWVSILLYHDHGIRGGGVEGIPLGYIEQLVSGVTQPNDIDIDGINGYIYICTNGGMVYKARVSGGAATAIAGGGSVTSGIDIPALYAQLGELYGICGDTSGNVYMTDYSDKVIWSYASSGSGVMNIVAGVYGSNGYTPDGKSATGNEIDSPWGVIVGTMGYLYWTESITNAIVRKSAANNGILKTVAGSYNTQGNVGNGGPATSASLYNPYYLFLDSNGNLYITDNNYGIVRKITASNGKISLYAGGGSSPANNIAATSANLGGPSSLQGIAGDINGNIYLSAAYTYYVYKVNSAGIISYFVGNGASSASLNSNVAATSASINNVNGLKVDTSGNLYIAGTNQNNVALVQNSRVEAIDAAE